ncbi:MAG: hypothetical protein WC008_06550 [Bacilli bacterium]
MKSTKKLLMATLMLVVAFVAASSATFAWFTMRQEAVVNDIQLEAASVGEDLQISKDGTTFGYSANIGTIYGKLEPVTFDATEKGFYKLGLTNENFQKKYVFQYLSANSNIINTSEEDADEESYYADSFLAFPLWFRTSNSTVNTLNFDASSAFVAPEDAADEDLAALKTLRIMFIVGEDVTEYQPWELVEEEGEEVLTRTANSTLIYEPFNEGEGTYGSGAYFSKDTAPVYIAEDAFNFSGVTMDAAELIPYSPFAAFTGDFEDRLNIIDATGDDYALDEIFQKKAEYKTVKSSELTAENNILRIGDLKAGTDAQIQVVIWIEGWDGDTVNNAALGNFIARLKFTATTVESEG